MGSKILTGSMLVCGPLLGIIMVLVGPGDRGDTAFADLAQKMLDNSTQYVISGVGWATLLRTKL